jgi:hypothetical protein
MKINGFFLKITVILISLFLLDWWFGIILQHYYFKIRHGEQGRTTYAIDSCTAEIIILGSSRAAHHYVTPVISNILGRSCYNAGKDKQRLIYCLAMLKMIYRRYSPGEIILDMNPEALTITENGLDELSVLMPYYSSHPEIRSILNQRNRFEWIKLKSNLYCYNSLPLKILFNNLSGERDENERSGYVPLTIQKEQIPYTAENLIPSGPIDTQALKIFKDIIRLAKDHHSKLFVTVSPFYYRLPPDLPSMQIAKTICREENVPFLDYSGDFRFLSHGPQMFLDRGHLNDSSAILFSTILTMDLKRSP